MGADARPLGKIVRGAGNRDGDGFDGAVQGSVVATYMHGCCLARNPELADLLLSRVVGDLPRWSCRRSTGCAPNDWLRLAAPRASLRVESGEQSAAAGTDVLTHDALGAVAVFGDDQIQHVVVFAVGLQGASGLAQ